MKRPSRWAYAIPIAAIALGALLSAVLGRTGVRDQVEAMKRFEIPGERHLLLHPGQHLLFVETPEGAEPPEVRCRLSGPSGREIPLAPTMSPERYRFQRWTGEAVRAFETFEPGEHLLRCEPRGGGGRDALVAVGRGLGGSLPIRLIPLAVGLVFGLFSFLVVAAGRRSRR